MTLRVLSFGRVAALLLFGLCGGLTLSATPAAAGCGYGCGGYAYAAPFCSCCGCGGAGYGYGYGGYGYPAPYGAYAAGWDGYDAGVVVAPRYWGHRRSWGRRGWW